MENGKSGMTKNAARKIVRCGLLLIAFLVFSSRLSTASAQEEPRYAPDTTMVDLQARVGFDISKKLGAGFQIGIEEELRLKNLQNMSQVVDGIYSTVGASYRPARWFRLGINYTFIAIDHAGKASTGYKKYWDLRHRGSVDLLFTVKKGAWQFSFRERPQATYRTDSVNVREKTPCEVVLRHRFKVEYEVFHLPVKPYLSVEFSNTINAPKLAGQYIDKVRSVLGVEWRLDKRSSLDFFYRFDYSFSRDVHITKNKGKITITPEHGHYHILGAFYSYSF